MVIVQQVKVSTASLDEKKKDKKKKEKETIIISGVVAHTNFSIHKAEESTMS